MRRLRTDFSLVESIMFPADRPLWFSTGFGLEPSNCRPAIDAIRGKLASVQLDIDAWETVSLGADFPQPAS